MKVFSLLLCCTLVFANELEHRENPVVHSPTGSFCGSILKSQTGKDMFTFRGIRYAEAPTGRNRFKQATLAECHEGVFDATKDGPICPQPNAGAQEISEDCLRLNVYTTALPHESHQPNRSVIVFFHTGNFATSSGSLCEVGPQYALDENVVFVSFNYRLGALGFLSVGDKRAPGNAGLKDQVLALRWVQQNIAAFGGNPNLVTLMAQGAGSISASLHMVSPMSKGLFHRVLTMSGATTSQRSLPTDQYDLAERQAELLGCPIDTLDEMFDCLYEKSAQEYADSYTELARLSDNSLQVWSPVVESSQSDEDDDCDDDDDDDVGPFLTGQPEDLIQSGNANFVPLYLGVNMNERGYLVIPAEEQAQCGNTTLYDELNNNWEELAPKYFGYESGTPRSCEISKELKSFYLHDEPLKAGSAQQLAQIYTDALTTFQVHRFERLMATYSHEPIWYYKNNYKNSDTLVKWSNGTRFGIVSDDETPLLFNVAGRPEHCENDERATREIWRYISNFADTGNPIPADKAKDFPVQWKASTKDQPQYLDYASDGQRMICGFINQERMDKWDELFPLGSTESVECDD